MQKKCTWPLTFDVESWRPSAIFLHFSAPQDILNMPNAKSFVFGPFTSFQAWRSNVKKLRLACLRACKLQAQKLVEGPRQKHLHLASNF
jgi:hypothetical protein